MTQDWTVGALLDWTAKHLAEKGVEFPRLDAEVLLAHAAQCRRIDLYGLKHSEAASPELRKAYRELIQKRLEGCPVAYLVGRKEFYGLDLAVSPAVLIPRPDSEHVVVECLSLAKKHFPAPGRSAANPNGLRILDVGAGSGNLALALAKHLPSAQVTAVDISAAALAQTRSNAEKLGLAERVRFLQGDLFAPLAADEMFEFIVSNPPYIAREDWDKLPAGVKNYEPRLALDGGPGGFAVFDRLVEGALPRLVSGGFLIVEIGSPQEAHARQRFERFADYTLAPTIRDSSNHPRVLRAQRK